MEDSGELEAIVAKVIAEHPDIVERIKGGNAKAMGALVGPVMRETKGRADGGEVNRLLRSAARASKRTSWTNSAIWTRFSTLELVEQPRDVRLHGRDAHVQLGGDLGVRAAAADGQRDLVLARAQRLPAGRARPRAGRRRRPPARSAAA